MSEIEQRGIPLEEPEGSPEEREPRESRPLPPAVKLLILVAGVAIMAGGAFFLTQKVILPMLPKASVVEKMTEVKQKLQKPKKKKVKKEKKEKKGPVIKYPITGIVANTAGSMGRALLAIDIMVETSSEKSRDEMADKEYQIRDALIYYFGGRTLREISTRHFMVTARDTVRSIINSIIESEPVDTIFFTSFIIQ